MIKQLGKLGLIVVTGIILAGCNKVDKEVQTEQVKNEKQVIVTEKTGGCTPGKVEIEGYGDPGKRLANCFVEYPGEPSREDKSYYVVEDVCGQFTKEFVQNALEKSVIKTIPPEREGLYNCSYVIDDKDNYVMLVFEYLSIENQKKGQEMMGRKTEESERIPMRNLVVTQEDGAINTIYLVLGDEKFISIKRSEGVGLTNEELLNFASKIASEIKDYK